MRRPWGLILIAAALFGSLCLFMRLMEREAVRSALIDDQIGPGGKARPLAEVAQAVRSMKLVTVEVSTKVTSESGHDNWRGAVDAKVTAPVRLLYGADLSALSATSVAYSPLEKIYLVRVPMPTRIATEVCGDSEQVEVQIGWLRLRSRAGEYYLGLARRDLYERARAIALSPEDAAFVRKTTREQVESLVKKVAGEHARVSIAFDDDQLNEPRRAAAGTPEVLP